AVSPMILYRMAQQNRYRIGWGNRLGRIRRKNPDKKCIWIHAVSVGEVNAARTIIDKLLNKFPEFEIVVSTTTDTGYARAKAIFGDSLTVIFFPLDFSWIMRQAFERIQPALCLLMELEVWPNFVHIAKELNIPVVVVNGRISDRSFSRYKLIRPIAKKIFSQLSLILAQTEEYAGRFREISSLDSEVIVTGSLKYDTAQTDEKVEGADAVKTQLGIGDEKLWVAGGTGIDEEKILLDVYRSLKQNDKFSDLRLVIVPRKPERFDEVAQLIEQFGFNLIRYSRIKSESRESAIERQATNDQSLIILGDTMGDLRKFYSLATIIFVGRSLVPMGGSDMMEAAALGKCTMFGPHAFNFKQAVEALLAGEGAIMVKDGDELQTAMERCLLEPGFAQKIADNGRSVIKKNQGATKKTIEQISKFLRA
ncbi:MAG: 3-deoxy-D-manno-octulosonic acid transferase, partial [Planctomycetota bacterium]|nr:3-deoxy-D-manno-octulosonic acid transferase [Planctomycetota bacterium]